MFKIYVWCVTLVPCVLCTIPVEPKFLSMWRDFPIKILMNTTSLQPECGKAYRNFVQLLEQNDLNAMKMLDATAKLPSGLLQGNIIQYGNFDECMEVETAQYCLVEVDVEPLWQKPYSKFKDLVHSFYFFKEEFTDPAHRIPGFTMARWGFCIPRECSPEDLKNSLQENYGVRTQIRPGMCQKAVKDVKPLTTGDYVARIFFATILSAVVAASFLDYCTQYVSDKKRITKINNGVLLKLLLSFSLQRNWAKFLEIKENDNNQVAGLHGMRFLAAFALLMSHKSISLFYNPYMNRTPTITRLSKPWTILARNAIVYTDVFMFLSGFLNANALLSDLNNGKTMKFGDKLINRIFRILPNVVALILFCTYILPSWGAGPLWPTVIDHHSVLCKQYMWRNIFFVHNYFGFENMCLTHTHQLGIDMQLFLITPILIHLIWTSKTIGFLVLGFLAAASSVLRFWVAYQHELTSVVYFGIPISKMFAVANLSYILPTHRATIYLIGVACAYFLKYSNPNPSFTKIKVAFLWCFFLACFLGSWIWPYHMVQKNYIYNKVEASINAALYPIFFGVSISFGVYTFNRNLSGWFGKMFDWKYFQIATKVAYALYLVQFPVFFYNVGLTKHVDEYQSYYQLQIFETVAIILCSLLLVFSIEMPFQNIKRAIFDDRSHHKTKVTAEINRPTLTQRKFKAG